MPSWRHWRSTWETWVPRELQGRSGAIWPTKSGATLTPNANVLRKCKFYGVLLKVRSLFTVIYREVARRGIPATSQWRIQDRQDPTDKSVWGMKVLRMRFSIVESRSGLQERIFSLFRSPQLNSRKRSKKSTLFDSPNRFICGVLAVLYAPLGGNLDSVALNGPVNNGKR